MSITPSGRHLGRKRAPEASPPERRFAAMAPHLMGAPLPELVDLHDKALPPFDQGQLGSCGPNSGAGIASYLWPGFMASRLAWYYWVREREFDTGMDAGVMTEDVLRILKETGAAAEVQWPYDIDNFRAAPSDQVKTNAAVKRIQDYSRVVVAEEMYASLAAGVPFILGFQVPSWFDEADIARNGVMRKAKPGEDVSFVGGHDVAAFGYDLDFLDNPDFKASGLDPELVDDGALLIRNSWGTEWGLPSKPGHFWMPISWATTAGTGDDAWAPHLTLPSSADDEPGVVVDGVRITGHYQEKS